jgi:thiol-disulfide isomerase/thioredoxin
MTEQTPALNEPKDNKPSPVLVVLLIVPLLGILIALVMIATNPATAVNNLANNMDTDSMSLMNFIAPPFDVLDPNGDVFSLLDYKGRVVFLNFWQTTCEPCKREMPDFAEFVREQGNNGATVIAINFDETTETVKTWLAQNDVVGLTVGMDFESRIQRAYGVTVLPTTFVINPEGVVVYIKYGEMTLDEMQDYLDSILSASS